MRVLNNDIYVRRNETFTLDRVVQNKDGSPFIVSKLITHPYLLLVIANTNYASNGRYLQNYWLDLSDAIRFNSTEPVDLLSIKTTPNGDTSVFTEFTDDAVLSGYIDDKYVEFEQDDALFYLTNTDGSKEYKYYDFVNKKWFNYEFRIVLPFLQNVTRNWVEQEYEYSISLVSGQPILESLQTLCNDYGLEYSTTATVEELYNLLQPYLLDSIDIAKPLGTIDTVIPILPTAKIFVYNHLGGRL